jgi:hypothetical protein
MVEVVITISVVVITCCIVVLTVYAVMALKGISESVVGLSKRIEGMLPRLEDGMRSWGSLGEDIRRAVSGADRAISDILGLVRAIRTASLLLSAGSGLIRPSGRGIWRIIGRIFGRKGGEGDGEGGG